MENRPGVGTRYRKGNFHVLALEIIMGLLGRKIKPFRDESRNVIDEAKAPELPEAV
jgi:hypothetical protein